MLDFYLLGLARSGTSAFCQALNQHPNIYCGVERFPISLEPGAIVFPDSFLDESIKANPLGFTHAQAQLGKTDDVNRIRRVGDKSPRKFYCPSHLSQTQANILIYRSYANTTASWDSRAKNSEDAWSTSRTGLFFFLDLLLMLNALPFSNRLAIVNYEALFFGDYAAELNHVFKTLNIEADAFSFEQFNDQFFRQKDGYVNKTAHPRYDQLARFLSLDEFESAFFNCQISERCALLNEFADYIKTNQTRFFNQFVSIVTQAELDELYWLTGVLGKNLSASDRDRYFPQNDMTFKLFLDNSADQSTKTLLKLVDVYPQLEPALLELSKRYYRASQFEMALDYANKAQSTIEKSPHHLIYFARLLTQTGHWQHAEKTFENALDLDAGLHLIHVYLNQLYMQQGKLDKALASIDHAIEHDPVNPKYHLHRGNTLVRAGDIEQAFSAYNKALECDPTMSAAYVQLSHLWVHNQQIEPAISAVEKAISLDGNKANYYLHLGNLRRQMGESDAAANAYQKAREIDPCIDVPLNVG